MLAADFPPVETLVPHRGPALLIGNVLAMGDGELRCTGRIPVGSVFADDGAAESFVGLELAAQAAAALEALMGRRERPDALPGIGYIVGLREARFDCRSLPVAEELRVQVRLVARAASLATHEMQLFLDETLCLSARISTYRAL